MIERRPLGTGPRPATPPAPPAARRARLAAEAEPPAEDPGAPERPAPAPGRRRLGPGAEADGH
ncbi:hypothetical protein [Streptomyces sp. NBC_01565]|uniref:hypothetical protein n=1 Tax=Streptomyces sp. NBC_01565 TaxID=2975881 RepID=UPI00225B0DF5|nr:hypothetical protein [Streptomyces sp. NBC_01565]MCX4547240.1 hypothetical protein [Streptomyces sp. NBC_01565]